MSADGAQPCPGRSAPIGFRCFIPSRFIPSRFIPSRFIPSRFIPSRFIPSRFIPIPPSETCDVRRVAIIATWREGAS
jgi:hypothetical protein